VLQSKETQEYLICKDFRAVEADTAHNGEYSLDEADVEHGFGQLKVAKVAWAFCHPGHASLALDFPVDSPKPWVTKPCRFRLPPLHSLCMLYLNDRHLSLQNIITPPSNSSTEFVRAQHVQPNVFH
jgi:hypothetical protein